MPWITGISGEPANLICVDTMEFAMSSQTTQDSAFTDLRPGFGSRLHQWMIRTPHEKLVHGRKTNGGNSGFSFGTIAGTF